MSHCCHRLKTPASLSVPLQHLCLLRTHSVNLYISKDGRKQQLSITVKGRKIQFLETADESPWIAV